MTEIRAIEGIDGCSAELYGSAFRHVCQFTHRDVKTAQIRTDDSVPSGIPECTRCRLGECASVKPFVRGLEAGVRIASKIGPIVQFARSTGIDAQEGRDRQTALSGINTANLPAVDQPR